MSAVATAPSTEPKRIASNKEIALSDIRTDGGTQLRVETDSKTVEEYTEALGRGDMFPAVVLFYDGKEYWMADGFHRFLAHHEAGRKKIRADIYEGTKRHARLYAAGANDKHGLKRSAGDKRNAVKMLLADREWSARSIVWIAQQAGVGTNLVKDMIRAHAVKRPPKIIARNGRAFPSSHDRKSSKPRRATVDPSNTGNEERDWLEESIGIVFRRMDRMPIEALIRVRDKAIEAIQYLTDNKSAREVES